MSRQRARKWVALLEEPISALVRRPPVTIQRGSPLADALAILCQGRTRCLVVMDGARAIGLLTDRDLVEKCFHEGISDDTPVETIMDSPFISLTPDTPIRDALAVVDRERIRHLPLIDENGIVFLTHPPEEPQSSP